MQTDQAIQFEALRDIIHRANCTVKVVGRTTEGLLVFSTVQQTRHWDAAAWGHLPRL